LFIVGPKLIIKRAESVDKLQDELHVPELDLLGPAADSRAVKIAVPAAKLSPEIFKGD